MEHDDEIERDERPMRAFFREESAKRRAARAAAAEAAARKPTVYYGMPDPVLRLPPMLPPQAEGPRRQLWQRPVKRQRPLDGKEAIAVDKFWRIFHAQAGRCFLCPQPFTDDDWATVEHVKPRALGGMTPGNVLLAHASCNQAKDNRPPHPCEVLYLQAVNLQLKPRDLIGVGYVPPPVYVPLRLRSPAG